MTNDPYQLDPSSNNQIQKPEKRHPLYRQAPLPPSAQPPRQPEEPARPRVPVIFPQSKPVLTYLLVALNAGIYIVDLLLGGLLVEFGVKDNGLIAQGELWRLVTPMFLHGSLMHIFFNDYFLYVVGPRLERSFGYGRFLLLYLYAGVAGVVGSFAFSPRPSLGASGALFGLMGAMLVFLYRNREILGNAQTQMMSILRLIGINLLIGLMPGIDNWGHIGGLVGGILLTAFITPLFQVRGGIISGAPIEIEDASNKSLAAAGVIISFGLMGAFTIGIIFLRSF